MLWALDLSSGDFGAFPHKQRPSILSAGRERESQHEQDINKKKFKKKEKKERESQEETFTKRERY